MQHLDNHTFVQSFFATKQPDIDEKIPEDQQEEQDTNQTKNKKKKKKNKNKE